MSERSKIKDLAVGGITVAAVGIVSYLIYKSWRGKDRSVNDEVVVSEKAKKKDKKKESTPDIVKTTQPAEVKSQETKQPESKMLSKENLIAMFQDMVEDMSGIMYTITQEIHEMQAQGVPDSAIEEHFNREYQGRVKAVHERLLIKYKTEESFVEMACAVHGEDPKFKKVLAQLEKMQRAVTGQGPDPEEIKRVPSWMDVPKVIEIFGKIMNVVTGDIIAAMEAVYTRTDVKNSRESEAEIQKIYKAGIEEKKEKIFSDEGIDESVLDLALNKYSTDKRLAQAIMSMQAEQKKQVNAAKARFAGAGSQLRV
jgi:hypothetical protein